MNLNDGSSREKGKGRYKIVQGQDVIEIAKQTTDPNFTVTDTFLLLNVMDIVKDLSAIECYGYISAIDRYKKNEWGRVKTIYNDKTRTKHTAEVLKSRWKNLRADFDILKALMNRSGWGWDSQAHIPIPPSENEWTTLVQVS
jgi:Myb/SANT-like DNA-binding domain